MEGIMTRAIGLGVALLSAAFFLGCGAPEQEASSSGEGATAGAAATEQNLVQPSEWWSVHPRPGYAELEWVGNLQNWFEVYRLTDGTYAIYEPNQFEEAISYLVEGTERAVLIDTGNGIGNIREVVEALTDLPVSVILTHEHYDHVAGAWRFQEIAAFDNAESLARLALGRSNESLQRYVADDYLWKPLPEGWDPSTWTIPPIEPTELLHDGDMVDLGGRTLEVIYTPGHSPGSMCLLDSDHRLLFTGDHFFPGPLYAHADDVVLEDYIASNQRLADRIDEYDWLLSGHNEPWVSSEVIPRVSEAFETIFSGGGDFAEADGLRRYTFQGFDVLIRSEQIAAMVG
jgi:glyoxylase-like metal-dependent hydrolase (beta-lactamase superfamily II)